MVIDLRTTEWLDRIGAALRQLRLARNLSQTELASRAGIGRSAVQNLEAGRGTLTTLVRIVRALDREEWLASLADTPTVNPLHLPSRSRKRQRASGARRGNQPKKD